MKSNKCTSVYTIYTAIFLTLILLAGCNGCQNKTQKTIEAKERVSIKIERFDNQLFSIDTQHVAAGIEKLYEHYGDVYISYAQDVLRMPVIKSDTLCIQPMKMLLSYKPMLALHNSVDSMFKDMSVYETTLSNAMSVYHQEFKTAPIPRFITFISEFGYANITYPNAICIGLDMYMNKRFIDYYRAYEFPEFKIRQLQPEYIIPNAIKSIAIRDYEYQTTKDKRFLATMINEGKIRYFTKALLPNVHDTIIMAYTAAQLKWSIDNESQMWTHFIEKNLLFNTEATKYMRYFNDAPFTSADGVPAESSPMIATWAGLQIIRNYMNQNPNVTLKELMEETNCDKILKLSKYRPK